MIRWFFLFCFSWLPMMVSAQPMAEQKTLFLCVVLKTDVGKPIAVSGDGGPWCQITETTTSPAFLDQPESVSSQILYKGNSGAVLEFLNRGNSPAARYLVRVCPTMFSALLDEIKVNDALMAAAELPQSKEHIAVTCSFSLPVKEERSLD
ncbi:hypothetical protein [Ruegeria jejuensis]|uniref:hypothetical protein n=1 Tax=Ruegeria jejuensis TaxID=3233338 RepID=UPI00355B04B9